MIPLHKYFTLRKTGRYDLIVSRPVHQVGVGFVDAVSRPLALDVRKVASSENARRIISLEETDLKAILDDRSSVSTSRDFDYRWQSAISISKRERARYAFRSNLASDSQSPKVNLTMSIAKLHIGTNQPDDFLLFADGATYEWIKYSAPKLAGTPVGNEAKQFAVLIRDATGREVPMNDAGRAWVASHRVVRNGALGPGECSGFVFPLDKMYPLKEEADYWALPVFFGVEGVVPVMASAPIRFTVHRSPRPGLDRPLYGSTFFSKQLFKHCGEPQLGYALRNELIWTKDAPVLKNYLEVDSSSAVKAAMMPYHDVLLVLDSDGRPLVPDPAIKQTETPIARKLKKGQKNLELSWEWNLSEYYTFRPGGKYYIVSGVNLAPTEVNPENNFRGKKNISGFVVSKPISFIVPEPRAETVTAGNESKQISSACDLAEIQRKMVETGTKYAKTATDCYQRFAGNGFLGLSLNIAKAESGENALNSTFVNKGEEWIMVKKWMGIADYDIALYDPDGKLVPRSSRRENASRQDILDAYWLKPHEQSVTKLELDELFNVEKSGDYMVQVSVPLVGDVDAVLSASPVKVQLHARGTPQK